MNIFLIHYRQTLAYKALCLLISLSFSLSLIGAPAPAQAQTVLNLPMPGAAVPLTPAFHPPIVQGITVYPDNPMEFDFIIDGGDDDLQGEALRTEANKLIKYFLASLTIPEEDMWVNLSPYEKNRIIPNGFGRTEMGRDLLAQDYILKQLTASLMSPEDRVGKAFWERVRKLIHQKYGAVDIPTQVFHKVWIVPEEAVLHVKGNNVFVAQSRLKVFLEEDYMALYGREAFLPEKRSADPVNAEVLKVMREIIIPEIEKEVNEGRTFANLRQIYNSMILATWYKRNLRQTPLGQAYVNQQKLEGIDIADADINAKIYAQYIKAFEKGVYDFIKEDYDPEAQEIIPRRYFSGGMLVKGNYRQQDAASSAAKVIENFGDRTPNSVHLRIAAAEAQDASEMREGGVVDEERLLKKMMKEGPLPVIDDIDIALVSKVLDQIARGEELSDQELRTMLSVAMNQTRQWLMEKLELEWKSRNDRASDIKNKVLFLGGQECQGWYKKALDQFTQHIHSLLGDRITLYWFQASDIFGFVKGHYFAIVHINGTDKYYLVDPTLRQFFRELSLGRMHPVGANLNWLMPKEAEQLLKYGYVALTDKVLTEYANTFRMVSNLLQRNYAIKEFVKKSASIYDPAGAGEADAVALADEIFSELETLGLKPSLSGREAFELLPEDLEGPILSIGISDVGATEIAFAKKFPGKKIIATTIDADEVYKVQRNIELAGVSNQVEIRVEDATEPWPYKDKSIGFVYARLIFHYLAKDDLEFAFKELKRVAAQNSKVFISVLSDKHKWANPEELYDDVAQFDAEFLPDPQGLGPGTVIDRNTYDVIWSYDSGTGMTKFWDTNAGEFRQRQYLSPERLLEYARNAGFDTVTADVREHEEQIYVDFARESKATHSSQILTVILTADPAGAGEADAAAIFTGSEEENDRIFRDLIERYSWDLVLLILEREWAGKTTNSPEFLEIGNDFVRERLAEYNADRDVFVRDGDRLKRMRLRDALQEYDALEDTLRSRAEFYEGGGILALDMGDSYDVRTAASVTGLYLALRNAEEPLSVIELASRVWTDLDNVYFRQSLALMKQTGMIYFDSDPGDEVIPAEALVKLSHVSYIQRQNIEKRLTRYQYLDIGLADTIDLEEFMKDQYEFTRIGERLMVMRSPLFHDLENLMTIAHGNLRIFWEEKLENLAGRRSSIKRRREEAVTHGREQEVSELDALLANLDREESDILDLKIKADRFRNILKIAKHLIKEKKNINNIRNIFFLLRNTFNDELIPELREKINRVQPKGDSEEMRIAAAIRGMKRLITLMDRALDDSIIFERILFGQIQNLVDQELPQVFLRGDVKVNPKLDRSQIVYVDWIRLTQVIMNLFNNAYDAMEKEDGKKHALSYEVDIVDGNMILKVTDTGVGISPDIIARIFDPEFTTKTKGESEDEVGGEGEGLTEVRRLLRKMGGDIIVESDGLGKGATVQFWLPLFSSIEEKFVERKIEFKALNEFKENKYRVWELSDEVFIAVDIQTQEAFRVPHAVEFGEIVTWEESDVQPLATETIETMLPEGDAAVLASELYYEPGSGLDRPELYIVRDGVRTQQLNNFGFFGSFNDLFEGPDGRSVIRISDKHKGYVPFKLSYYRVAGQMADDGRAPRILTFGFTEDDKVNGYFFVEVEKIAGTDLLTLNARLSDEQADRVIELIRYLMDKEIFTNGFKPENVMLGMRQGEEGPEKAYLVNVDRVGKFSRGRVALAQEFLREYERHGWSRIDHRKKIRDYLKSIANGKAAADAAVLGLDFSENVDIVKELFDRLTWEEVEQRIRSEMQVIILNEAGGYVPESGVDHVRAQLSDLSETRNVFVRNGDSYRFMPRNFALEEYDALEDHSSAALYIGHGVIMLDMGESWETEEQYPDEETAESARNYFERLRPRFLEIGAEHLATPQAALQYFEANRDRFPYLDDLEKPQEDQRFISEIYFMDALRHLPDFSPKRERDFTTFAGALKYYRDHKDRIDEAHNRLFGGAEVYSLEELSALYLDIASGLKRADDPEYTISIVYFVEILRAAGLIAEDRFVRLKIISGGLNYALKRREVVIDLFREAFLLLEEPDLEAEEQLWRQVRKILMTPGEEGLRDRFRALKKPEGEAEHPPLSEHTLHSQYLPQIYQLYGHQLVSALMDGDFEFVKQSLLSLPLNYKDADAAEISRQDLAEAAARPIVKDVAYSLLQLAIDLEESLDPLDFLKFIDLTFDLLTKFNRSSSVDDLKNISLDLIEILKGIPLEDLATERKNEIAAAEDALMLTWRLAEVQDILMAAPGPSRQINFKNVDVEFDLAGKTKSIIFIYRDTKGEVSFAITLNEVELADFDKKAFAERVLEAYRILNLLISLIESDPEILKPFENMGLSRIDIERRLKPLVWAVAEEYGLVPAPATKYPDRDIYAGVVGKGPFDRWRDMIDEKGRWKDPADAAGTTRRIMTFDEAQKAGNALAALHLAMQEEIIYTDLKGHLRVTVGPKQRRLIYLLDGRQFLSFDAPKNERGFDVDDDVLSTGERNGTWVVGLHYNNAMYYLDGGGTIIDKVTDPIQDLGVKKDADAARLNEERSSSLGEVSTEDFAESSGRTEPGRVDVLRVLPRNLKVLVLDWEGTIQESINAIEQLGIDLFAEYIYGQTPTEQQLQEVDEYVRTHHMPLLDLFAWALSRRGEKINDDFQAQFTEFERMYNERLHALFSRPDMLEWMPLIRGMRELLETAKERGIILVVASNLDEKEKKYQAAQAGLAHFFEAIYGGQSESFPAGEYSKLVVLQKIEKETGLLREEIGFLDDNVNEIKMAEDNGFIGIGIAGDEKKAERFAQEAGAHAVIHRDYRNTERIIRLIQPTDAAGAALVSDELIEAWQIFERLEPGSQLFLQQTDRREKAMLTLPNGEGILVERDSIEKYAEVVVMMRRGNEIVQRSLRAEAEEHSPYLSILFMREKTRGGDWEKLFHLKGAIRYDKIIQKLGFGEDVRSLQIYIDPLVYASVTEEGIVSAPFPVHWEVFDGQAALFTWKYLRGAGLKPGEATEAPDAAEVGGINLNPQNLNIDVQGDTIEMNLPALDIEGTVPAGGLSPSNIKGFIPVIIDIKPITNLPLLLGLKEGEAPEPLAALAENRKLVAIRD